MERKLTPIIRLYNKSKQMLSIQVKPPHGDFFLHEQQVRINPGVTVKLPKSHLLMDQLRNLQSRRLLKIVLDSEATDHE